MPTLERRVACLEQVHGAGEGPTIVVRFVSPSLGLVGLRCGDLTLTRLEGETETQFLLRSRQELAHVEP